MSNSFLDEDVQSVCRMVAEFLNVHNLTHSLRTLEPEARIPKIPRSQASSTLSNGLQREIFRSLGVDFVIAANNALAASPRSPRSPRRNGNGNSGFASAAASPRSPRKGGFGQSPSALMSPRYDFITCKTNITLAWLVFVCKIVAGTGMGQ